MSLSFQSYITDAIRTKAETTDTLLDRLSENRNCLYQLIRDLRHICKYFDLLKKKIYYNKHNNEYIPGTGVQILPKEYKKERLVINVDTIHAVIGIITEVGELAEMYYNYIYQNEPFDDTNIAEELGDIMWYIAILCHAEKFELDNILTANISKLKIRYPSKFTEQHAVERNLETERVILETELDAPKPASKESLNPILFEWNFIPDASPRMRCRGLLTLTDGRVIERAIIVDLVTAMTSKFDWMMQTQEHIKQSIIYAVSQG